MEAWLAHLESVVDIMEELNYIGKSDALKDFEILRQIISFGKPSTPTYILHASSKFSNKPICRLNKNLEKTNLAYSDTNIWSFVHCQECMQLRDDWIIQNELQAARYIETDYARRKRIQIKLRKSTAGKKKISESFDFSSNSVRTVRGGLPSLGKRK